MEERKERRKEEKTKGRKEGRKKDGRTGGPMVAMHGMFSEADIDKFNVRLDKKLVAIEAHDAHIAECDKVLSLLGLSPAAINMPIPVLIPIIRYRSPCFELDPRGILCMFL
jgi:hypothetical protein